MSLEDAVAAIRALGPDAPPGIAIAVVAGDREWTVVDGLRQRDGLELPLTLDTRHDLASVTKVVATTASLMRLDVEVDRAVDDILPGTSLRPGTTIRELLWHRAGLWEWWPLYFAADPTAELDRVPLRYEPGSARHYSDLGFMLLGRIVEVVSGVALPDAVAELVLGPLGLTATGYARPVAGGPVAASSDGDRIERTMVETGQPYPVPFRAGDFTGWRERTLIGEVNDGNAFHAFEGISGHAGLFSTVPELLRFASAMAGDDFVPAWVRREFFAAGPDPIQALGFRRSVMTVGDRHLTVIEHPGFTGCVVGWVPDERVGIVLATNRLHVPGAPIPTDRMWRIVLDAAGRLVAGLG